VHREEISGLVGRKVAVRLNSVEARGVEMVATLDEVRDDGVILSEIGELGHGPTMFCPWESLHRVRGRPPWFTPPHEEPEEGPQSREFYELREASEEEIAPEPIPELRRPRAQTAFGSYAGACGACGAEGHGRWDHDRHRVARASRGRARHAAVMDLLRGGSATQRSRPRVRYARSGVRDPGRW
jgi:hypothetical protein